MKKQLIKGKTSIAVVNYNTHELTKLCLKSIRANTNDNDYELIVVDNNSTDSSLDYLRTLKWIKLIERKNDVPKGGSQAQGTALDIALANATGEFFLAMHSDTIIRKPGWLNFLKEKISEQNYACAGTGKLDTTSRTIKFLREIIDFKKLYRYLTGNKKEIFYIRAICAIYRTEILLDANLSFARNTDSGVTCAKQLYLDLLDNGYKCNVISPYKMAEYVLHLEHATMVLNSEFKTRKKTKNKYERKFKRAMLLPEIQKVISMPD